MQDDLLKELDDLPGAKPRTGKTEFLHASTSAISHGPVHGQPRAHAAPIMGHSHSLEGHAPVLTTQARQSNTRSVDFKLSPHPPPASEKPPGISGHLLQKRLSQGGNLSGGGAASSPTAMRSVSGTAFTVEPHSKTPPPRSSARRDSLDELLQDLDDVASHTQAGTLSAPTTMHRHKASSTSIGSPTHHADPSRHPSFRGAKCTGVFLGGTKVQR
jgi:hypothetical protein